MKKIIFICTGNICRSAMAEHYMQKKINDLNKQDQYLIDSCGILAGDHERSTINTVIAMKDYGVKIENHRSKNMNIVDLDDFDIILCMTSKHKLGLLSVYPNLRNKVFTLKEYVEPNSMYKDINDPWGYNIKVYRDCAKEIVEYVDKLIDKLEGR